MYRVIVTGHNGKSKPADKVKEWHETPESAATEAKAWAFYGWKVEVK